VAQILVRNLDSNVVAKLKERAKREGRSLESEVRSILEAAASEPKVDMETARKLIEDIRERFEGRQFPDSVDLIREDRDR
jgi:plasmid stability protein